MEQACVKSSQHRLDDWLIILKEHHILKSLGEEREAFERSLELPTIPEMIFDQNSLSICFCQPNNEQICKIEFNALDALKLVDPKNITIEVSYLILISTHRRYHLQRTGEILELLIKKTYCHINHMTGLSLLRIQALCLVSFVYVYILFSVIASVSSPF